MQKSHKTSTDSSLFFSITGSDRIEKCREINGLHFNYDLIVSFKDVDAISETIAILKEIRSGMGKEHNKEVEAVKE